MEGEITAVTDFGVFVELEEGIEGLVHVSEFTKAKGEDGMSLCKVGETIQARVAHVSPENKRIGLSLRIDGDTGQDAYTNYVNNPEEATSNLGELLQNSMMNLKR